MSELELKKGRQITPDMTVLDVIDRYRDTESVFRKYDEQAGVCIYCQALFETIGEVAKKYRLNLEQFLADLEDVIHQ
jgi:thiol-disulfide isomerase/thioredoxin